MSLTMVLLVKIRKASAFFFRASLLFFLFILIGCAGSTGQQATSPTPTATSTVPPTTATVKALIQKMTLVGQPTAKMLNGTTFEVTGQLKNGDSKQHDITLQAALLDGSGKAIATATTFLDNIKGGQIVVFTIDGNTSQPTWNGVQVTVIKISENIGGTGDD